MANNTELNSTPDEGGLNLPDEDAQAFMKAQEEEHSRIKRMVNFIRKTDELDFSIHAAIENILSIPLSPQSTTFSMSDVADIIHGFPTPEQVLEPKYFRRVTLPFRLLRRCLDLHLVNPIDEETISTVHLPEEDKEDSRLSEQIWFLLFLGAPASGITESLRLFREQKSSAQASTNRISYDNNNNLADFSRREPLNGRTIHNQAISVGENFVTSADPTYIPSTQSPESRSVNRLTESRPTLSRAANIQPSHQNAAAQASHSRSGTTFDQSEGGTGVFAQDDIR